MSDSTKLLELIYEGAQMGHESIMQLEGVTDNEQFRRTLDSQRREYRSIMDDADRLLGGYGKQAQGVSGMSKLSSRLMIGAKTLADDSVPQLAEMLIQGSTMGTTKLTRRMGELPDADEQARGLSERLLRTEENNIEQMKGYLAK